MAWGWGWPGEGAPGYWPWIQVMRTLGLDIPWPAEDSGQPVRDAPASERFRLFDEVTSLLLAESRIQPLLLLLDDLQWPTSRRSCCSISSPAACPPGRWRSWAATATLNQLPARRRVRRWPRWRRGPPCCR